MWRQGGRGRQQGRNQGQWPGNGPFSHLPPWQRPGWIYGPGSCWTINQRNLQSVPKISNQSRVPPEQPLPYVSFCQSCGEPLVPNARYCSACGVAVDRHR
ncbi:MAG: zinc ribbon domain-containing protein [Promethearchaeota archaeon]